MEFIASEFGPSATHQVVRSFNSKWLLKIFLFLFFSGIPHLAVSNSTPPPSSSSPAPVKIKAEPISPPRDQLLSQHQQQSIVTSLGGSSIMGLNSHSSSASLGSNLNHSHMMNSRPSSTGHSPTPGWFLLEGVY